MRTFDRRTDRVNGVGGNRVMAADVNALQEAIEDLQDGTLVIPHIQAVLDAIPTEVEDVTNMRVGVYNVLDYGAVADGVTDDSAAIQACIDAAYAAKTPVVMSSAVKVLVPPGVYRIRTTLKPYANLHFEMYGARFIGPIDGYPRITAATAIPDGDDVTGQTGGACFGDTITDGPQDGMVFMGGKISGFRWGFCSVMDWPHVHFSHQEFDYDDACWFFYGGTQNPTMVDPIISSSCHVGVIHQATCIPAGHPWQGTEGVTGDGPCMQMFHRHRGGCHSNVDVDDWIEDAILRPSTATTHQYAQGDGTYPFTGTFRRATGRLFYAPNRSLHGMGLLLLGPLNGSQCDRGTALVVGFRQSSFKDIVGEAFFHNYGGVEGALPGDGDVPSDTESTLVLGVTTTSQNDAVVANINGYMNTGFAAEGYKQTVDVVPQPGTTATGNLFGYQLFGEVQQEHFLFLEGRNTYEEGTLVTTSQNVFVKNLTSIPSFATVAGANIADGTTRYNQYTDGPLRRMRNPDGYEAHEHLWAGRLPLEGGAQTAAYLRINGAEFPVIKGILDLLIERLDTGGMDSARYLVSLPSNQNATTLGANITAGATTFTVAAADTNNFPPGTSVTLNGTEIVRVKERSGQTITTDYPIVGNFTAGDSVVAVPLIVRTLDALAETWVTVDINNAGGFDMLRILNTLHPIPVVYHAVITAPKATE